MLMTSRESYSLYGEYATPPSTAGTVASRDQLLSRGERYGALTPITAIDSLRSDGRRYDAPSPPVLAPRTPDLMMASQIELKMNGKSRGSMSSTCSSGDGDNKSVSSHRPGNRDSPMEGEAGGEVWDNVEEVGRGSHQGEGNKEVDKGVFQSFLLSSYEGITRDEETPWNEGSLRKREKQRKMGTAVQPAMLQNKPMTSRLWMRNITNENNQNHTENIQISRAFNSRESSTPPPIRTSLQKTLESMRAVPESSDSEYDTDLEDKPKQPEKNSTPSINAKQAGIRADEEKKSSRSQSETELAGSRSSQQSLISRNQSTTSRNDHDVEEDKEEGGMLSVSVKAYHSFCAKNGTTAQSIILKQLTEPEVNIRYRSLASRDMIALAVGLCNNKVVDRLELRGNDLQGSGAVYFKTVLAINHNITYVDLSENNLGSSLQGAAAVGEMLKYNKGLECLRLAGNRFRDDSAELLAAGLQVNRRLEELDLSNNDIGEAGAIHIGRALVVNIRLDRLDLSVNNICRKGAVAICNALKLNISSNGFGYEGSLAVGELLRKNSTITQLNLSSNRINWQGAMFIAKGLAKNSTLQVMKLDCNPLTTTGCMDIIEAVRDNHESALHTVTVKDIPVVVDFKMACLEIQDSRFFYYEHGQIVGTHDILGQRVEKRVMPMQKVLDHLKERELRATELFRAIDKDVAKKLTPEQVAVRLKLPPSETQELIDFIYASFYTADNKANGRRMSTSISYQKVAKGVQGQATNLRMEKIAENDAERRLRARHKKILTSDQASTKGSVVLPPIGQRGLPGGPPLDEDEEAELEAERYVAGMNVLDADLAAMMTGGAVNSGRMVDPAPTGKLMSMSTKLGAKAKGFGEAAVKKKKKTKKVKKHKK